MFLHKFLHLYECIRFLYSYLSSFLQKYELTQKVIEGMVAQTLRCIAFAHYLMEESQVPIGEEAHANQQRPKNDFILLTIVGIKVWCTLDKQTCIIQIGVYIIGMYYDLWFHSKLIIYIYLTHYKVWFPFGIFSMVFHLMYLSFQSFYGLFYVIT